MQTCHSHRSNHKGAKSTNNLKEYKNFVILCVLGVFVVKNGGSANCHGSPPSRG